MSEANIAMRQGVTRLIICTRSHSSQGRERFTLSHSYLRFAMTTGIPNVFRVVLTGGPCGGKSSAIPELRRALRDMGFTVFHMSEVASILLTGGCKFPVGQDEFIFEFESTILHLQLTTEESFLCLSKHTEGPVALLFDRGTLDVGAFLTHDRWSKVMELEGVNQEQLLDRYDLVLHFSTTAFGAETHFKTGETTDDNGVSVTRTSTLDQARDKDTKAKAAWKDHNNVHILHSAEKFTDKVAVAIDIMREEVDKKKKYTASTFLSQPLTGCVTMHPALSLVILLQDKGVPLSAEQSFSMVDVERFKQLTGFTKDNGWELRMATPPLWGGNPVERHLTILSLAETITLNACYSDMYPHNLEGGFVYNDLSDTIKDDEIRKQYDEGKFLALDGSFQPLLDARQRPLLPGQAGQPVFKMALYAAMTKAVGELGQPNHIQFVVDDTIVLELSTCTFLETLATKALAIGVDEKTKSYCRKVRSAMGLRPDFPKVCYTLQVTIDRGAIWTEVEGKADTFEPHATLANAGPTTETLAKVVYSDVKGSLLMLAKACVKQRIPHSLNQGFVSFGPATEYMRDSIMFPSTNHLADTHDLNVHAFTYAVNEFPAPYDSAEGNFDKDIKDKWDAFQGRDEEEKWVTQSASMYKYELQGLMHLFVNVTSEEDKKRLPTTCRFDHRSPIEKLRHHSKHSQEVALMIAKSIVGKEFVNACEFWENNTKGGNIETELENLACISSKVAGIVEQALNENRKA